MSEIDVKYLAELAKLRMSSRELEEMQRDMRQIVALMDEVASFDGQEELRRATPRLASMLRDDVPKPSMDAGHLMKPAAKTEGGFYVAPKVV